MKKCSVFLDIGRRHSIARHVMAVVVTLASSPQNMGAQFSGVELGVGGLGRWHHDPECYAADWVVSWTVLLKMHRTAPGRPRREFWRGSNLSVRDVFLGPAADRLRHRIEQE